jgi:DNA mismatch repair protein MutL
MQDIIKLLPDAIANQIAAGEVVQRPASVVKELLENAIDAHARNIQLIIRDAGRSLVQIIDDGSGMSETDARMSFERHATSKIRSADDLFKIKTMGFRGEALASIAAVAQVELRTRRAADEIGTVIRIEGSDIKSQESVACLSGTNLLIKNLFFNVPARRNFLKTNSVEMRHILDEFQRVALANSEISCSLYHNDTEVYNLYGGKLNRRIVDMFGKNYRENLINCQEETPYVSVRGYIGKPEFARKTRGEQFFFVNNRFVRHSYLHHAVMSAYEGTLSAGNHPFYVLFIDIDPVHIDINIHPTKTEIKFDDERSVYGVLMAVIRKAVSANNLSGAIDFETNADFLKPQGRTFDIPSGSIPPYPADSSLSKFSSLLPKTSFREQANLANWDKLFEGVTPNPTPVQSKFEWSNGTANAESIQSITATNAEAKTMQILNKFVIVQTDDGALLINQRAAYERILYDRFRQQLESKTGLSQQLLFEVVIQLNPADIDLVMSEQESINHLGFDFDALGHDTVVLRSMPVDLPNENAQKVFEEMVEQIKTHHEAIKLDRLEATARLMSRRFAHQYLTRLEPAAISGLMAQLYASSNPNYTAGGEVISTLLTVDKLTMLFRG